MAKYLWCGIDLTIFSALLAPTDPAWRSWCGAVCWDVFLGSKQMATCWGWLVSSVDAFVSHGSTPLWLALRRPIYWDEYGWIADLSDNYEDLSRNWGFALIGWRHDAPAVYRHEVWETRGLPIAAVFRLIRFQMPTTTSCVWPKGKSTMSEVTLSIWYQLLTIYPG